MSGKAILIPGCNFQSANLGIVSIQSGGEGGQEVALQSISIEQSGSYTGRTLLMSVTYQPFNTTQIGVTWSIVSGGSYATISANGVLTFDSSANTSQVVVQATSISNSSITATTTLTLTYDADAKYNVTWLLASNTVSTSQATQVNAGETFTFTLSSQGSNLIGDFKITMGGVNVSKQCTLTRSRYTLFHNSTWEITTPVVTGDLIITNECHGVVQLDVSNTGMARIREVSTGVWKPSATNNFVHYRGLVPAIKGDKIKCYITPTMDTTYNELYNDSNRYVWRILTLEFNASWSDVNVLNKDVTSYITVTNSTKAVTCVPETHVATRTAYEVTGNATTGVYCEFSLWDYSLNNGAGNCVPFSNSTVWNKPLDETTLSGPGIIFGNIGNITGGTKFILITINETILEGGYYEDYNYGVTELPSSN